MALCVRQPGFSSSTMPRRWTRKGTSACACVLTSRLETHQRWPRASVSDMSDTESSLRHSMAIGVGAEVGRGFAQEALQAGVLGVAWGA